MTTARRGIVHGYELPKIIDKLRSGNYVIRVCHYEIRHEAQPAFNQRHVTVWIVPADITARNRRSLWRSFSAPATHKLLELVNLTPIEDVENGIGCQHFELDRRREREEVEREKQMEHGK